MHGFTGNENGTLDLKDEILKTDKDAGGLTVDGSEGTDVTFSWLKTAHTIFTIGLHSWLRSLAVYQQAASNTRYVGAALANIIKEINLKYPGLSFHCIGHSLGAHVCGFAGKSLLMTSSLVLDRIYAFNPAGPLFLPNKLFPDFQDNPMA